MHVLHSRGFRRQNAVLTLGDLIAAVSTVVTDEREVVAMVRHMLRCRSIRLAGPTPVPVDARDPASEDRE